MNCNHTLRIFYDNLSTIKYGRKGNFMNAWEEMFILKTRTKIEIIRLNNLNLIQKQFTQCIFSIIVQRSTDKIQPIV